MKLDESICEQFYTDAEKLNLKTAVAYYENLDLEGKIGPNLYTGLIDCYLGLDQPLTALRICQGVAAMRPEMVPIMEEFEAEAFWRMCDFEQLENLVERTVVPQKESWSMSLSHALLKFCNPKDDFLEQLGVMKNYLLSTTQAISIEKGSYQEEYVAIVRAHIMEEIEQFREVVETIVYTQDVAKIKELADNCMKDWKMRIQVVKQCAQYREPILCVRRFILLQSVKILDDVHPFIADYFYEQVGRCWIDSAVAARIEGQYQQAYGYMLNADNFLIKELYVEQTKLLWEKGDQETAFTVLRRGLRKHIPQEYENLEDYYRNVPSEDQKIYAEGKLLLATYLDETTFVDVDANIDNYKKAVEACKSWEKSYVCLAQYYERAITTLKTDDDKIKKGGEFKVRAVYNYARSLEQGCEYVYKSLPCLLTIWLDLGTEYGNNNQTRTYSGAALEAVKNSLTEMNEIIQNMCHLLPTFLFLPVYSQLMSRVCHPDPEVFEVIKEIATLVLAAYPQQVLWMTVAVCKSTNGLRAKRCRDILNSAILKSTFSKKYLDDFLLMTDKFLHLTDSPLSEIHKTNNYFAVSKIVLSFPALFQSESLSQILMPVEKFFKLVYPKSSATYSGHRPYQADPVHIVNIRDQLVVLPSLQRPRRVTVVGSDGKEYRFLCKSKDDLRKDSRYMEFCTVFNSYLRKDAESRQRNLHVRTYHVAPLNEDSGLIEWVPDLITFRGATESMYKQGRIYTSIAQAKKYLEQAKGDHEKLKKCFVEKVLPLFPDILDHWFTAQFPEPHKWYKARTAYVQTTAVMSMVGYILGLGDRHGENILFDTVTGETVHVDFNCLFNKGETFTCPERVPFRLTHNIVAGMGPLGVEGIFRKCCEITLRLIRSHRDTLTSVLRPFIYDPLVSWNRRHQLRDVEYTNELAVKNLKDLERRLQGMVKIKGKECNMALSVEGQIDSLILEATDIDNLCEMYVGWAAFL